MELTDKIRKRLDEARSLRRQGRGPEAFTAYEDVVAMLESPARVKPHVEQTKKRRQKD